MMKINLLPPYQRCQITICKPSRRYRNVSLTTKKVNPRSTIKSRIYTKNVELTKAMDRMVDNRLFKI